MEQMLTYMQTIIQKHKMFYLEQVQIYPEGEYEIEAKLKSDMILDVNGGSKAKCSKHTDVGIFKCRTTKFILSYTKSDNTYTIKAKHSNKVITTNNNGSVYQYDYTGEDGQKWYIKRSRKWLLLYKFKITRININNSKRKLSKWNNNKNRKFKWKNTQKFKFFKGIRTYYEKGNYGKSGLAVIGDPRGSNLEYYKFGKREKMYYIQHFLYTDMKTLMQKMEPN